tara:strand:+ start:1241 stop:1579 length:339 start_codon:yes stop_codon:yes gene_type:complete
MSSEPVSRLYDEIETMINGKKVDASSIISIATLLMKTVETYSDVKGIQKKEIVLAVLRKVVEEKISSPEERANVLFLVEQTVPPVIDALVAVDKGQLKIKIQKGCKSLFPCC